MNSATNDDLMDRLARGEFDFIDIGTHEGAGFRIGAHFNRDRGLGFELNPEKARSLNDQGLPTVCGDIIAMNIPARSTEIVVLNHILEHLPNLYQIGRLVEATAHAASDFLYIAWPYFDSDDYLYGLGLKAVHTAISEHLCRFTTWQLASLLRDLDLRDFLIAGETPMLDSRDEWLHSADVRNDVWLWQDGDPAKRLATFDRPVFRNAICVVALKPGLDLMNLALSMRGDSLLLMSRYRYS